MSGGNGACAVCKHQRRKCEPNCELAAYFPANKMNDFRALHLVFGVANLTKLIKANDTEAARRRAAETLTWEAQWRERDPAEGCYREVSCLRRENTALRAENVALRRQTAQCACCAPRHAPSPAQQQQQLLVSAYDHGNTRPCNTYSTNGGVVLSSFDGSCYNICYNGNGDNAGAIGVRGVNGNGVMAVMPPAPTPAMQTTISFVQDDRYRAMPVRAPVNGGHGEVSALGSGVAG